MPSTIRVKAVDGRHSAFIGPDGDPRPARFAGRGPGPAFEILPDGEEVADTSEYRRAVAVGDLVLVEPAAKEDV